jgi:lipopolysaccharide export system permease protein
LKKIDKLISTSFIGPAILSYFIATFVLIMQFLWKYIDEILGKGLSIFELLELIFYYAVTLIPMAVPITVLISSVMVFGDMAEKYELSSMKSAGISLIRIMLPSMVIACGIGLFSLFAANFLKPASLLQFNKRFIAIRKQKSALAIEQGIFNNTFNETIIRVNEIEKNKKDIHDVLIYDHTANDKSLIRIMSAKSGQMYTAQEGRYFVMELDTGVSYQEEETRAKLGSKKTERPFTRMYFDQWSKTFDMSLFDTEEGLLNFNRDREQMMNSYQLFKAIDSFQMHINDNNEKIHNRLAILFASGAVDTTLAVYDVNKEYQKKYNSQYKPAADTAQPLITQPVVNTSDSLQKLNEVLKTNPANTSVFKKIIIPKSLPQKTPETPAPVKKLVQQIDTFDFKKGTHFAYSIDSIDYKDVLLRAQSELSRDKDELLSIANANQDFSKQYEKYMLRLNQQYSWAVVCVLFLFIGAPLGSIIRKGGYGYPLLVAILFYMIFIISTIYGEKLVRSDATGGMQAAWIPCLILSPWALLLTYMAIRDTSFNPSAVVDFFVNQTRKWRKGSKLA